MTEKAAWVASAPAATATSSDSQKWEAEKADLIKARDEALAKHQVSWSCTGRFTETYLTLSQTAAETISKLTQEVAQLRHANVRS